MFNKLNKKKKRLGLANFNTLLFLFKAISDYLEIDSLK